MHKKWYEDAARSRKIFLRPERQALSATLPRRVVEVSVYILFLKSRIYAPSVYPTEGYSEF